MNQLRGSARSVHRGSRGDMGGKAYAAPNPAFGATIYYFLGKSQAEPVQISIIDPLGNLVAKLKGVQCQGLHKVAWALERVRPGVPPEPAGSLVSPGQYVARLKIGTQVLSKEVRVEAEE